MSRHARSILFPGLALALVSALGSASAPGALAQPQGQVRESLQGSTTPAAMELEAARRLAAEGRPGGLHRLGRFYEEGREVPRDPKQAVHFYERAANLGHAEAQFSLGLLLCGAEPAVPRSVIRSAEMFELAAMQGHARAQYFHALTLVSGIGAARSGQQAFEWYRQSAGQGEGRAMEGLARLFADGAPDLQRDPVKALAWGRLAAHAGQDVTEFTSALVEELSSEQIERAAAMTESMLSRYIATK